MVLIKSDVSQQSFLEELERTVALLAFEDVSNCPVGELLDISQRLKTASEVNAAILTSQSHEKGKLNFVRISLSLSSQIRNVHYIVIAFPFLVHCACLFYLLHAIVCTTRSQATKLIENADMGSESTR